MNRRLWIALTFILVGIGPSRAAAVAHCGGQTCETGEVCCGNACCSKGESLKYKQRKACQAKGKLWCGIDEAGKCYDQKTDAKHCGGCNTSCEGRCSNGACVPVSVQTVRSNLAVKDLNLAVSGKYVLASVNGNPAFQVFQRQSSPPFQAVTLPLVSGDGHFNLFRGLLYDAGPFNLNNALVTNAPIACTANAAGGYAVDTPFDCVNWPAGVVMSVYSAACPQAGLPPGHQGHNPYPTSSCVTELYEGSAQFDASPRQRFWFLEHTSNKIGIPTCDPSSTAHELCNKVAANARRYMVFAVSKTSEPKDGFWTYSVAYDHTDQPYFTVDKSYAIFYHQFFNTGTAGKVPWQNGIPHYPAFHVFDAPTLAGPNTPPATTGQVTPGTATELAVTNAADGKIVWPGTDIKGNAMRVAKHHEGEPGSTFIVTAGGTDAWIYALASPHPTGKTTLIGPAHFPAKSNVTAKWDVVFSSGYLYLTYVESGSADVVVHRVPLAASDVTNKKEIQSVRTWTLSAPNESVAYPTVDVTSNQDVVVSYVAFNKSTMPDTIKYATLYKGEVTFRPSKQVEGASFAQGGKGPGGQGLDYVASQRDVLDPTSIWTILADRDGVLLSLIRP
jgi:hypothetical protein